MKRSKFVLLLTLCGALSMGCTQAEQVVDKPSVEVSGGGSGSEPVGVVDPVVLEPTADGVTVYSNDVATVDCSNMSDGYVMLKYTGTSAKVRMLIDTPKENTYNYLVNLDGEYYVYPLSEGDGTYTIGVYENIKDDKYAEVFSQSVEVTLTNEYSCFLYPNAYVNFNIGSKAVKKGAELAAGCANELEVVDNVYHYMAKNIDYDYDKAATVKSGYVPTVDETLASGKGICFDYASLMATMLRSQGIPCRLEIGYAGDQYHAWIGVYTKDQGWIDDIIVFDGTKWTLMDPTLASYAPAKTIKSHWDDSDNYYQLKYKY